jgi:hypothetical protein
MHFQWNQVMNMEKDVIRFASILIATQTLLAQFPGNDTLILLSDLGSIQEFARV